MEHCTVAFRISSLQSCVLCSSSFSILLRTNVRHYSFNTLAQTMPLWGNWNNCCCGYVFTKRKSWSPLLHGDQYFFVFLVKYFIILYSLVFSRLWVYYVTYLLASINPIDKVVISHLPTGHNSWPLCKLVVDLSFKMWSKGMKIIF
jgi:hypothetical protein